MQPPPLPAESSLPVRGFLRRIAISVKLGVILVIALLLQIPLWMIDGLLRERGARRDQAIAEITGSWGRAQTLVGPILVVPYRAAVSAERVTVIDGRQVRTTEEKTHLAQAYFLPGQLQIGGDLAPSKRHRGIYDAVVYQGKIRISGTFEALDPKTLSIPIESLRWDQAWLAFGLTDLRGTSEDLAVTWNDQPLSLQPSTRIDSLNTGLHAVLPKVDPAAPKQTFELTFSLNGSEAMAFVPLGKRTEVRLRSTWIDPSFTGAFLPTEHTLAPEGFTATWKVSYYGRAFPQQWTRMPEGPDTFIEEVQKSAFGVNLFTPVDSYRAVERARKYGALFITLVFTAFFLFEVLSALRLHGFHYLLVGAALCLFYLGLLAGSEFLSFPVAYLSAACASTLLVGGYSRSILGRAHRSWLITGALAGIYAFLFFVLQLQDYALVAGTIALFVVLGVVMYATRKVDWAGQPQAA